MYFYNLFAKWSCIFQAPFTNPDYEFFIPIFWQRLCRAVWFSVEEGRLCFSCKRALVVVIRIFEKDKHLHPLFLCTQISIIDPFAERMGLCFLIIYCIILGVTERKKNPYCF